MPPPSHGMAWQDYMTTCEYRHSRVRVFVKPRGGLESRYNLQLIYGIRACVEGPRFDLDLRDSISAQVDETVPVYSILKYKYTLSYIYIIAAFYADATTARRGRGPLLSSPPGSACRG